MVASSKTSHIEQLRAICTLIFQMDAIAYINEYLSQSLNYTSSFILCALHEVPGLLNIKDSRYLLAHGKYDL